MRKINIFPIICIVTLLIGCDDKFLDVAPEVAIDEAKVFSNPVLAMQFADNAYRYRPDDYLRWNSIAGMSNVTDESVGTDITSTVMYSFQKGMWHDHSLLKPAYTDRYFLNDISGVWDMSYTGIRIANKMLSKMDEVFWTTQDSKRIKGEMYYLRASMYFELIKRFGGVVIMDKAYASNEDIDFPRSTYDECVSFILSDIEQAILLLPRTYNQGDYGRATIGAARALKSRLLLYAASPLHNPENDLTKWTAAASAAKDVMDMNMYKLHKNYSEILNIPMSDTCEYILIKVRGPRNTSWPRLSVMSPGSGGSIGEFNPTQNHVDLYEMSNGRPISDPNSNYDSNNPYANRDPRFYANILYNTAQWQGRKMEMWDGGLDYRSTGTNYTQTRYYCKKMWPTEFDILLNKAAVINFIFFRFGEILLNYAEAQNEALVVPDASVYSAINQIRKRAGMPDLPIGLTKEMMRDRIRNERAIELAFEDHRFYDVMRWEKGKEIIAQPVYGMDVVKNANGTFTYTPIKLSDYYQRIFEDYMHLYPIPKTEIQKSKKLIQNPGW